MARDVYLEGKPETEQPYEDGMNRRDFLKKAGIGGAGFVFGGALLDLFSGEVSGEAQAAEKAHAYGDKKIRILVKPYEVVGDSTIKRDLGTKIYSGDDGLAVKYSIETELMKRQDSEKFNKSGVFDLVEDTDKPDEQEADLVVKGVLHRSGNKLQFFTRIVDLRKGKPIYTDKREFPNRPGNVTLGGEFIATGLDNYLDNSIDELL